MIRDTGRDAGHLQISGHNPGLEDLILMLVPETAGDGLRAKVEEKLPTSALARLDLDIADWHDIDTGTARFADFIRPRDLDPSLAPAMDDDWANRCRAVLSVTSVGRSQIGRAACRARGCQYV